MRDGYVYFLRSHDRTRCKVGYSVDPFRRFGHIRIGPNRDLEFWGYVPGPPELESEFAAWFCQITERLPGACGWTSLDWFSYNQEVERIVEALPLLLLQEARELHRKLKQTRWDTPSKWKEQGK